MKTSTRLFACALPAFTVLMFVSAPGLRASATPGSTTSSWTIRSAP